MTYSQWADEYTDSADKLKEKIDLLKAELETANLNELPDLYFRINTLHSMYTECVRLANILRKRKGEV